MSRLYAGAAEKTPTQYKSHTGGLDPVALGQTNEPDHKQCVHYLVWRGLVKGSFKCIRTNNQYVLLLAECQELFEKMFQGTVNDYLKVSSVTKTSPSYNFNRSLFQMEKLHTVDENVCTLFLSLKT